MKKQLNMDSGHNHFVALSYFALENIFNFELCEECVERGEFTAEEAVKLIKEMKERYTDRQKVLYQGLQAFYAIYTRDAKKKPITVEKFKRRLKEFDELLRKKEKL